MKKQLFTSNRQDWETPQQLFDQLNAAEHFTLDAARSHQNCKCATGYTIENSGLTHPWAGHRVWCNPPYGRTVGQWVQKAYEESTRGTFSMLLLPARTDTRWFHQWIYGRSNVTVRFLKGRLKFETDGVAQHDAAPFPSMLVTFHPIA